MKIFKLDSFLSSVRNMSDSFVSESASRFRYFPRHKGELEEIIRERIAAEGPACDLNDIDTSHIDSMAWLFSTDGFPNFIGDISEWDVSNVKDMSCMFFGSAFNGDISHWDTSNVKHMDNMFERAEWFDCDLSMWNVSRVTTNPYMFKGATQMNKHPEKQPIFKKTRKVKTGYWHGENATVLYNDDEEITFIAGNYSESELDKIRKLFYTDDPKISKYDDYIFTVPVEEWEEQNR